MDKGRWVVDIESNNLLSQGIDYSQMPYRLKPDYQIFCIVARNVDTGAVVVFDRGECGAWDIPNIAFEHMTTFPKWVKENVNEVIGHNIVSFDLVVLMLGLGLQYHIGYYGEESTLEGNPCVFSDTLIMSKLYYSDTIIGHSLGDWGHRLGNEKIDYHNFSEYTREMLVYCIQDTSTNMSLYFNLKEKEEGWDWSVPLAYETKVVDLTVRQEHYGFQFDSRKAHACLDELEPLMEKLRQAVEPHLPPALMNKGEQDEYYPPKKQFKKDGSLSSLMEKWIIKHNGLIVDSRCVTLYGNTYTLPLPYEPVLTHKEASIEDIDHVKGYLIQLGWKPSIWKERDLTMDSKKHKRSKEDYIATVDRYVEQTMRCPFKNARLEILECTEGELKPKLMAHLLNYQKPLRVPTSPSITVPQTKELCPALLELGETVAWAKSVADFLTYRHRKNSIAGGIDEEGEPTSGYLTLVREDGRISTPADTNGAATGRYLHREVANIPRLTSLYGENMRSLFGVEKSRIQLGFDFASLEARIEGHYVYKYTDGVELADTLLQEKPNDIHTKTANKLGIIRDAAKNINYACLPINTLVRTRSSWCYHYNLNVGDEVLSVNPITQEYEWVTIEGIHVYHKQRVIVLENPITLKSIECTPDHKWLERCPKSGILKFIEAKDITPNTVVYHDSGDNSSGWVQTKEYIGDVFCLTTRNFTFQIRQNGLETFTGNCLYGAQWPKLAKMLGVSDHRAKEIFNAYWANLPSLAELKEKLEAYWERTGKKYILGIDGRKVYTRSKHSLLNSLFQSAGALAAKYAVVHLIRRAEQEGKWLDPFVYDVHKESGINVMIVYHDEAQLSISRDLIKYHCFDTEEDAKACRKQGGHLMSAVGHGKKWYVAESEIAEWIEDAINEVTDMFKLNVPLAFEWNSGRNWAQCH